MYYISLLVAVPPVTEKLTTTSKGREAPEGMMFIIIGRVISTSASFTTSSGNACKNIKEIPATIVCEFRKQVVLKAYYSWANGDSMEVSCVCMCTVEP